MIASYYYRITGLGGHLRRSLIQPSAQSRGQTPSSDQSAQGVSQLGLENIQGWRCHGLSGQTVSVLNYPHRGKREFSLSSYRKSSFSVCFLLLRCVPQQRTGVHLFCNLFFGCWGAAVTLRYFNSSTR